MTKDRDLKFDLITTVGNIFKKENECLLAELRSFVTDNAYISQEKLVAHLESKVDNQAKQHLSALEMMASDDRNSLLKEINSIQEASQKVLKENDVYKQVERDLKSQCMKLKNFNLILNKFLFKSEIFFLFLK